MENENTIIKISENKLFKKIMSNEDNYNTLLRIGKKGEGMYGVVYSAKEFSSNGLNLAVKRNLIDETIDFCGSVRELDILARLKGHPLVVILNSISFGDPFGSNHQNSLSPVTNSAFKDDKIHFIFEEADTDFSNFLIKSPLSDLKMAGVHLLLGLEYCHSKGIIHRDIKPENLLIFKTENSFILKICDFGLSKPYTSQGRQTPGIVTSWYRAPEIILNQDYNEKVDLWSVGCVFYEMIAKVPLLSGSPESSKDLIDSIKNIIPTLDVPVKKLRINRNKKNWQSKIRNFYKNKSSQDWNNELFIDLMEKLLCPISSRYSATEALNHPFFADEKEIIEEVRLAFPPTPIKEIPFSINDNHQRKIVCRVIDILFQKRTDYILFSDRIIFQSLSIFDRYLNYKDKYPIPDDKIRLAFSTCLYLSIKYFLTLDIAPSFVVLYGEMSEEERKWAEDFEIMLIEKILNYIIYQPTLYEAADSFNDKLNYEEVKELLDIMFNLKVKDKSINNLTPKQVYSLFRQKSISNN